MTGVLAGHAIDWLAGRRRRQLEAVWRDPAGAQERALRRLVAAARDTDFGLEHGFRSVTDVAGYQGRVPVRDYPQHQAWLERAAAGQESVSWPGHCRDWVKTSGTTSGDKLIPVTPEALAAHRKGGWDALLAAARLVGGARLMGGPMLFLGGCTAQRPLGPGSRVGDLSGLVASRLPLGFRGRYSPGAACAAIPDWETRLDAVAELVATQDIRLLSGMPSWLVILFERVARHCGASVEAIRAARAAGLLRADHYLHMRCEVSTALVVQDFIPFADDPLVRLVSLMDHAPGQRQFVDVAKYREYNQGRYGLTDAQLDALVERRLEERARYAEEHRAAITALCRKHGLPVASHDDATVAHVDEAMHAGAAIAEFPTTLEAARAAHDYGLAVLAGAPNLVRGRSHSGNVPAAELAARGWLDVLSSDYVPASVLHGAFLLHARHGMPLPHAIATVSATPARRVGLEDRGAIVPGRRADLVRVRAVGEVVAVWGVWCQGERVA